MTLSRRDLLRSGAAFAAGTMLLRRPLVSRQLPDVVFDDDVVRGLAMRALDAARSAGATYADVRVTLRKVWSLSEYVGAMSLAGSVGAGVYGDRRDDLAIGVHSLAGGGRGFASSSIWTPDEAARVGAESVRQARALAIPGTPPIELAAAPLVANRSWRMPIGRDPFAIDRAEVLDTLSSTAFFDLRRWGSPNVVARLERLELAFASSEGSYCTQTTWRTGAKVVFDVRPKYIKHQFEGPRPGGVSYIFPYAGLGWEYLGKAAWYERLRQLNAEQEEYLALPEKPVEVGRYDVVLDGPSIGRVLSGTIGTATELDRALGYEANAGGTSYLADPDTMIGHEPVGGPLVNVSANRSLEGGLATVKWDNEGVSPESFPLVKDGVLADYATTREAATWLKDGYARLKRPMRSHGCAGGETAIGVTQLVRPNLRLEPGSAAVDTPELIARMGNGIVAEGLIADMDFNALNGLARQDHDFPDARFFEVKRGKKVARLIPKGTAILFRAPELWKSVTALGGSKSVRQVAVSVEKGEPQQETWHTVEAPPVLLRQMAVIDPTR
jgi:TldD protein